MRKSGAPSACVSTGVSRFDSARRRRSARSSARAESVFWRFRASSGLSKHGMSSERFGPRHEFPHLPHPLLQHERDNHRRAEDGSDGADGKLDGREQRARDQIATRAEDGASQEARRNHADGFDDFSADFTRCGTAMPTNDTGPANAVTQAESMLARRTSTTRKRATFTPTLFA